MNKKRIISKLELKGEDLIKGIQLEGVRKIGKANEFATKYYNQGVDEIIFNDSVASMYNRDNLYDVIEMTTKNVFVPIIAGGGIRSISDARKLFLAGADKISINTAAIKNINFLKEFANHFGIQALVLSIEAKRIDNDWIAFYDNGRENSQSKVSDWVSEVSILGVGEILLTSVDKDGTGKGFDIELLNQIPKEIKTPFIVSGGLDSAEHIDQIFRYPSVDGAVLASSLHYNKFTIADIKSSLIAKGYKLRN